MLAMPDTATPRKSATTGANRRSGKSKGYRGQKGGAHQVAWRADSVILDRIKAGVVPWMERRSAAECLQVVNQYIAKRYPDEPPISIDTLYEDRRRAIELRKEQAGSAIDEHLAEYDHALAAAWQAFRAASSTSLNRSAYISTIGGLIERKAKLDGSLKPDGGTTVQVNVAVLAQQQADINAALLQLLMPYPELRVRAAAILSKYDPPVVLEAAG